MFQDIVHRLTRRLSFRLRQRYPVAVRLPKGDAEQARRLSKRAVMCKCSRGLGRLGNDTLGRTYRALHCREGEMAFSDRSDAGRRLAQALLAYRDRQPVILALLRGGVPVAAQVAAALDAPLDLILVRKIGAPMQPELAMGAVADGGAPIVVRNEEVIRLAGIDEAEFAAVRDRELAEIERRRRLYLGNRRPADVEGHVAIVIDDGVATGATTRAALRATRLRRPSKLVLAVPVAPTETLIALREEADDVVCLEDHESFGAIGFYYADFRQLSDQEVKDTVARFPARARNQA
jgi:putative phosphoribosyl transferase